MIQELILTVAVASIVEANAQLVLYQQPISQPLASQAISLADRQPDKYVNGVFRDNILLNMAYLVGTVTDKQDIDWGQVRKPFTYQFELKPGQVFAFHEDVLPQYQGQIAKTTNAHFNSQEGFVSDGYLVGDGVCHLASLIYWVAKEAGLKAEAPTNHNFASIAGIDRKYGVAVYSYPGRAAANARQNLYVTNNLLVPVIFKFNYSGDNLTLGIFEKRQ